MAITLVRSVSREPVARSIGRVVAHGFVLTCVALHAQGTVAIDPGVRGGTIDAGLPLATLTAGQLAQFPDAKADFSAIRSVQGNVPGQPQDGLGPRFNSNSCASCHAQPTIGGTSPSTTAFPFIGPNPEIAIANLSGATNAIPYFITADGPVREARFKRFVNQGEFGGFGGFGGFFSGFGAGAGAPDGSVHELFTITGRVDATNTVGVTGQPQTCVLAQPDFNLMRQLDNISFRIPTPLFGLGLIEAISDGTILANMNANLDTKQALGIHGSPNRNGNDGTITKFGWKAQNATLLMFAGEAYNVEMGVSNELFAVEHGQVGETLPTSCLFNGVPEDHNIFDPSSSASTGMASPFPLSDIEKFDTFMRFLAPPTPALSTPSTTNGLAVFTQIGCSLCHTPSLQTSVSSLNANLGPTTANLFSDLLVHHMGSQLADGITQGLAGPDQFRSAPLWGVGQRVFFLHDGRTSDLVQAINAHASDGSEANAVVQQFRQLPPTSQQDLLNFLRSL